MTQYADPERCPDCLGQITVGALSCPHCGLSLRGPVAAQLFQTLSAADRLLVSLRSAPTVAHAPPPAVSLAAESVAPPHAAAPGIAAPPPRPRATLSAASVPKILLGLGAVCLLVAALVFLAVAWSSLGLAGRTAVLVGFTFVSAGLTAWLARRDLRAASESVSLVTLGLLTMDAFGARSADWFGDLSTPAFLVFLGTLLATTGSAGALLARRTPVRGMRSGEVVSVVGVGLAVATLPATDWFTPSAALVLAVLTAAGVTALVRGLRLRVATVGDIAVTGLAWLGLTGYALGRAVTHATVQQLWLELEGWPLLAAAVLVAVPALLTHLADELRVAALSVAGLLLAVLTLLPFAHGDPTETTLATLVLMVVTGASMWFLPRPWGLSGVLALTLGAVWMAVVALGLYGAAFDVFGRVSSSAWSGEPGGVMPRPYDLAADAWLLPVSVVALVGVAFVLAHAGPALDRTLSPLMSLHLGVAVVALTAVATGMLYPTPIALVLAFLMLSSATFTLWSISRQTLLSLALAAVFAGGGLMLSWYDEWFSAAAASTASVLAATVHLRWRQSSVSAGAGAALASGMAFATWSWGAVAGVPDTWLALAAILVVSGLALLAPLIRAGWWACPSAVSARTGVEIGAGAAALVAASVGVLAAPYPSQPTWTAVYLTTLGASAVTMASLRPDRRDLAWVGGFLLAAASWVRLADIGVDTPEAYTLPSAVALCVVGLVRLRRSPRTGTTTALTPGLSLGLVPSLVWVVADPVALRSVLLGAACLGLMLAGLRLRWTAPLVYGATVGAVVVLRHAAPFIDAAVPRWVLIGSTGAVLIAVGVTWERRVQEARALLGYVRHLR